MTDDNLQCGQHDHAFGQDRKMAGETRTILVIVITATMMIVEIAAGTLFRSMALLADGLHMASHAAALSIAAAAYVYARRHAHDRRFSFGTGKVNALGGFSGAILLAMFAMLMAWESAARLIDPVAIEFDWAILVAVLGLLINGASLLVLGHKHPHDQDADHAHEDHNLRAAYLHVMADALTSVLAIFALLAGKWFGLVWMDPAMGFLGAVLVTHWSIGLLRTTGGVLLDRQGPESLEAAIRQALEEREADRVTDLHLWSIGPGIYAAVITIVSHQPMSVSQYKNLLPQDLRLAHRTIEVHASPDQSTSVL